MANGQFLTLENGKKVLKEAPGVSTGATEGNKLVQTNAAGKIDASFLPTGVGDDTSTKNAGEDLSSGDYVWIDAAGEVFKADKTNGRDAIGFVLAAATTGNPATIYHEGNNDSLSGLTIGSRYYLDTAGGVTLTPTTTDGEVHQYIGKACATDTLVTEMADCILIDVA